MSVPRAVGRRVALLVVMFATACGAPGVEPAGGAAEPALCEFKFAPEFSLVERVEAATQRWAAATGCTITVGDEGTPVRLASDMPYRPDGGQAPGWTSNERDLVLIHTGMNSNQAKRVMMHEIGHALWGEHTESEGALSGLGNGHTDVIDVASLESVCSKIVCSAFNPEG